MFNSVKLIFIIVWIKIQQVILVAIEIIRGRVTFYPPSVKSFERNFSLDLKAEHGLMFTNATSAMEAAMFSVGVSSNSIVGTTAFVIPSSYAPAYNLGAEIVFLDIDCNTLNLDYVSLIENTESNITTLVVTHFYGNPCDMASIMTWAEAHNIIVIEDCSHAHGAIVGGRHVGTWGHIGVFSLQGSKTVSAGEGAVAVTNHDLYYARMAAYGHQESYKGFGIDRHNYELPVFGYGRKMRIHPLGAVLATVDFKYLNHKNSVYSRWFKEVQSLLLKSTYFSTQTVSPDAEIAGYAQGLPVILNNEISADDFVKKLNSHGINCFRRSYIESLDYFGTSEGVPNSVDAFGRVIFIPFYQFVDFRRWSKLIALLKSSDNATS
ncbi:DegT/DnrJ/EryC1/StrS family aminotransferase [Pseudomonadales bacterium]|nr:DegT/DnrJ/EryC1/StrS family aminotransferase [Pseudomonadales bacterium]